MGLDIGRRLGAYEVSAAIGKGGMGEVYRARDTKLGRDVAIKTLPDEFARDAERLARFKREAQVLAALNHPNIAAIHGLEEVDGQPFLVLELVEGEDLAERLERGPIPVDETIEIAKQVAEALEEAHEKSVIHRDLKPANVKVTAAGVVKVLDFGLAKAFSGEASRDIGLSDSPTMTRNATAAGVVLGTAAYMSPEQAKGKAVDRRTDIWSFGALVYEMLTGRKAFAGEDVSETLAAILRDEPDWSRLSSQTPSNVRALAKRCLRKNPRERQRDMGDARLELDEPAEAATPALPRRASVLTLVAGIAMGALAVATISIRQPPPPLVTKMVIPLPQGQRLVERRTPPLAVSPDGRTIVYAAVAGGASNLYRRPLDNDDATPIPGTEGGHTPFFSPDGEWLGFFTDTALKKIPFTGGAAMTLAPAEPTNLGASWSRNGTIVYAPGAGADAVLMKISQSGGAPEPFSRVGELANPVSPQVLPDGESVLFTLAGTSRSDSVIASLKTGTFTKLDTPGFVAYAPTGHLLHWSSGSIAAIPFDVGRQITGGDSAVVIEGVVSQTTQALYGNPYLTVSKTGTLAYVTGAQRGQRLVLVRRDGSRTPLIDGPAHAPRFSPDGRRVANGVDGIWIYDIERATRTRLIAAEMSGAGGLVSWRRDGRTITFSRENALYEAPADGSSRARPILEREHNISDHSWSDDSQYVALTEANPTTGLDIWVVPTEGDPVPFLTTPADENAPAFSPNGRFIAYQSNEAGHDEVYVRPFPELDAEWRVSTLGGTAPVWSRSGTELYYRQGESLMAAPVETETAFNVGNPEALIVGGYIFDATGHPGYDVTPDGETFIMIEPNVEGPLTEIHVVLNWFEELNRLVPVP